MATLQEQNEAFDGKGAIVQKVKAAMLQKARDVAELLLANGDRAGQMAWVDDILKNPNALEREEPNVRRYVFSFHGDAAANKQALLDLIDTDIQTAVDAYVKQRFAPA